METKCFFLHFLGQISTTQSESAGLPHATEAMYLYAQRIVSKCCLHFVGENGPANDYDFDTMSFGSFALLAWAFSSCFVHNRT